uniref:TSA: Wollemia nobilis Ref_Wollemi_Transcript_18732_873 transcribed RNA sequence n=1 Tax=Wollemia nobilis TaxID=56998 RepID=A0A0C9S5P3_9CONI
MKDAAPKEEAESGVDVYDVEMEVKLEEAEIKQEEAEVKDEPMSSVFEEPREDKVIREIDVYFTPRIESDTKLYLMQYPLRPYWRPYGLQERCEEVRVKPKQSRLEVDLVIEKDGENYDEDAKEHLKITKQTLTSSKTPLLPCYALGILRGNKLCSFDLL